jgi:hypothetical protein
LIDEGLFGQAGARTILRSITPDTRLLNASHNDLGDDGLALLCEGLAGMRVAGRHPGLTELSLCASRPFRPFRA